jgi:DnaJ-class molecular chaperone
LAKIYHPDVLKEKSQLDFKEINAAYQVLIDPEKRKLYDIHLENIYVLLIYLLLEQFKQE